MQRQDLHKHLHTKNEMTGRTKFDNSEGTVDYFLVTDYDGNAQGHRVKSMNDYR